MAQQLIKLNPRVKLQIDCPAIFVYCGAVFEYLLVDVGECIFTVSDNYLAFNGGAGYNDIRDSS